MVVEESQSNQSQALVEIPHDRAVNVSVQVAQKLKKALAEATPEQYKKKRQGPGGKWLTYAPWGYTARVLNQAFGPAWSMTITDVKALPLPPLPATRPVGTKPGRAVAVEREEIVVTILLETPFGKQQATGSHTYYPSNAEIGYGDVIQSAQSQALKRAAARWGVALDIYLDDGDNILPDPDSPEVAVWQDALARHGLTEKTAVAMLSEALTDDQNALRTVADIAEALDGAVADVVAKLDEVVSSMNDEPAPPPKKRGSRAAKS